MRDTSGGKGLLRGLPGSTASLPILGTGTETPAISITPDSHPVQGAFYKIAGGLFNFDSEKLVNELLLTI